jgi:hypothetical protein
MSRLSGERVVIMAIIWWWQKLGKDWQRVNNQTQKFTWRNSFMRNLRRQGVKSSIMLKFK